MTTALITGATGSIGYPLALALLANGVKVFATGKQGENWSDDWHYLGLRFSKLPDSLLKEVDTVYHLAAITDTLDTDAARMMQVNADYPFKLFHACCKAGVPRIVYASSAAVYGNADAPYLENSQLNPLNCYAASKIKQEEYATKLSRCYETKLIGLRFSNVYGPHEAHKGNTASMIFRLMNQMREGNPKLFRSGEQYRDWVYYKDVVYALLKASEFIVSSIINIGSGYAVTFNQLVTFINNTLNTSRSIEYIDNPHKDQYQSHTTLNVSKAESLLRWCPKYLVAEGIYDLWLDGDYYKA